MRIELISRTTLTYELPAAARTLSFGKLVSMSMRDRSRGKSRGVFSSDRIPSLVKKVPHEPESLPALMELALLLVRLVAQPTHVTPDTISPVVNWCTILLLSAPTKRTDPSLQAIASSCPNSRSVRFYDSGSLQWEINEPFGFHRILSSLRLPVF
jgi:hypothetical protein